MAIVCKCQSQEGTTSIETAAAEAVMLFCCMHTTTVAVTGLVTKGFVIAMPTFHAFFITHGRTFTPWMNSSFPQCVVCVCIPLLYRVCTQYWD